MLAAAVTACGSTTSSGVPAQCAVSVATSVNRTPPAGTGSPGSSARSAIGPLAPDRAGDQHRFVPLVDQRDGVNPDRRVQLDGAGHGERVEARVAVDVAGHHARPGGGLGHPDNLLAADRHAARRRRGAPIVGAKETLVARADPGGDAIVVEPEPADRGAVQPVDDRPAMPVVTEEPARTARPDALRLHRPPRRQRDDVTRRAGRQVAQLAARFVGGPAAGLVGAGDPGAPLVVDGDRRERVRPLGVAVADHLVVAAATSHRRSPGAPAAQRYGAFAASAVIGPVSARSTIAKSAAVGVAGPLPTPA